MITIAEQRRVYDAAVVHLDAARNEQRAAGQVLMKANEALDKAHHQADTAWKELLEKVACA